ncbi:MAG TPA: hypothetical protein VEI51_07245 [Methanomicrobiales archaeon]|nr:hypothetical protein [Methanomicrobiales archaeon]
MKGKSGQLPVDFLVGFTIFILSFIMVANFVPSLLVGLQRTTGIDYDAVAYRTGVVLVEDPGEPAGNRILGEVSPTDKMPWELQDVAFKSEIDRLGLAISPDTPNVLSINKINKFFDTSFFDDQFSSPTNDYRTRLFFSSYQYGYNITLQNISPMKPGAPALSMSIGQPYPAGYGYIRRYVLIRQNTNATVNLNQTPVEYIATTPAQVNQQLRIRLDGSVLYDPTIPPAYQVDLLREPFTIQVTNLSYMLNNSDPGNNTYSPIACRSNLTGLGMPLSSPCEWNGAAPTYATLRNIYFYDDTGTQIAGYYTKMNLTVDGVREPDANDPVDPSPLNGGLGYQVTNNITLDVSPLWPPGTIEFDAFRSLDIGLDFTEPSPSPPRTLITGEFLYDYNNATVPDLSTGMLEVGIW